MNGYKLHSEHQKVVHEDKVSKTGQFGTLTCSPVSPDSSTTMPGNQGTTHFCYQNKVNFTQNSSTNMIFFK